MRNTPSDEEIVAAYKECLSAYRVAERLSINWKTVYNALARSGVAASGLHHYRRNAQAYSAEDQVEILGLYNSGIRTPELVRRFGGSGSSIRQAILRNGGQMRPPPGRVADVTEEQAKEICEKYRAGMSTVALATVMHHSQPIIRAILTRNGIPLRKRHKNPSKHRYVGTQGYVWAKIQADDPLAVMASTKGMVQEHRLVLARHLGRPLSPHETVHHINGDRTDNRLENLQLRNGRHGKGRVLCCADCGSRNIIERALE